MVTIGRLILITNEPQNIQQGMSNDEVTAPLIEIKLTVLRYSAVQNTLAITSQSLTS